MVAVVVALEVVVVVVVALVVVVVVDLVVLIVLVVFSFCLYTSFPRFYTSDVPSFE